MLKYISHNMKILVSIISFITLFASCFTAFGVYATRKFNNAKAELVRNMDDLEKTVFHFNEKPSFIYQIFSFIADIDELNSLKLSSLEKEKEKITTILNELKKPLFLSYLSETSMSVTKMFQELEFTSEKNVKIVDKFFSLVTSIEIGFEMKGLLPFIFLSVMYQYEKDQGKSAFDFSSLKGDVVFLEKVVSEMDQIVMLLKDTREMFEERYNPATYKEVFFVSNGPRPFNIFSHIINLKNKIPLVFLRNELIKMNSLIVRLQSFVAKFSFDYLEEIFAFGGEKLKTEFNDIKKEYVKYINSLLTDLTKISDIFLSPVDLKIESHEVLYENKLIIDQSLITYKLEKKIDDKYGFKYRGIFEHFFSYKYVYDRYLKNFITKS